jgi:large subunit ribosomal protein L10
MPNLINEAIRREYEEAFSGDLDTLFLQPVGMSVQDVNAFRGKLGEAQLRMSLLKGSLAQAAMTSNGLEGLDDLFAGPAALIFAESDDVEAVAIAASRVVEAWKKDTGNKLPVIKGGVMDGLVLDEAQAVALAKLPTKPELQSILSGQIIGPAAKLSSQFKAPAARIAGAIKSHIEKLEGEG